MQLGLCLNEFTLYLNRVINELCKKASQKVAVLSRLSGHLHNSKATFTLIFILTVYILAYILIYTFNM